MQNQKPDENLLSLQQISKGFPGVKALDAVDLDIRRGETHVLLGENGAGKSTLVNILSGIYAADTGSMVFDQTPYQPASPREAMQSGVQIIHQELSLLNYLSVAENILFQNIPRRFGLVDFKALNSRAQALLDDIGLALSPATPVEHLSVAQMQMVEIAKALSSESKLLIMDEPTAALTNKEINRLFEIIQGLKQRGVTIIYISHRLQEVFEIGDRFTVLKNGKKVSTDLLGNVQVDDIVKLMVGHDLASNYPFRGDLEPGREMLRVDQLQHRTTAQKISFSVHTGEILGIAGLVGSGRSETLRAIFGADRKRQGKLWLDGQPVRIDSPKDAVDLGVSLLTENRKEEGLLLEMDCGVNITLANLAAISRAGLLQTNLEHDAAGKMVDELAIKTPSIDQQVGNLSGGNQQKIVLAKWLFRNARLIMVDEPTRGIDVGARYEIYQLLGDLAAAGKAIIVVSSDLPELMGICHRMLVFSNSKITGELDRSEFDQEKILLLAYQEYTQQRDQAA